MTISVRQEVRPRYTGGSPAQVEHETATRVLLEERCAFERAMGGGYGQEYQQMAGVLGLDHIVFTITEFANRFEVDDRMTGVRYTRPFKWRAGDVVDIWNDEEGWVPAHVVKHTDSFLVAVRRQCSDGSLASIVEVPRDLLRLASSVRWTDSHSSRDLA